MDKSVKIELELLTKKFLESINILTYGKEVSIDIKNKIQDSIKNMLYNALVDMYTSELNTRFDY